MVAEVECAIRDFTFAWSERPAPGTTFRAFADGQRLHFVFEVEDDDIVVAESFASESTLDGEDRVEVFFAADTALTAIGA